MIGIVNTTVFGAVVQNSCTEQLCILPCHLYEVDGDLRTM